MTGSSSTCSRRPAQNVVRGADLLDQMLAHFPERADLARDIVVCEQEGDRITHDIHQRLNSTFVTPIDREDILELASDLDDIIDLIDEVADYLGLYKIEAPMEQAQRMAHILLQATRQIAEAMPRLRTFQDMKHYTVEVNRLENEGDRTSRNAIASLFDRGHRPDGRDPLEGHLRAPRGGDRRLRARGEHARGHRDQEQLSGKHDPMGDDVVLVIVVATALAFDFTNGFHDTANAIATSVSTRAMSPRTAVALSAVLNFAGAFISLEVAATVASGIVDADAIRRRSCSRADRRDRVEPGHLVVRPALELVARADRRRGRRRVRGRRAVRRSSATAWSRRSSSRLVAPVLAFLVARWRSS